MSGRGGRNCGRGGDRGGGHDNIVMTQADLTDLINTRVAEALAAQQAGTNNNNNAGNNNNGSNGGNGARGRAFTIGAGDARNDGNVMTGTFSINGIFTTVLFDFGADWSYVSLGFSHQLGLTPTPLEIKHVVELADGKSVEASHVLLECKLNLLGQVFDIDLLSISLGSFDIVVRMDWLSKHRADIICKEKIVRIPLPSGESLSVQGHRSGATVSIISSMKAQKCLRKGDPTILALVTITLSEEKKIEDLPVVREFPNVFPEELPGLPPNRQVEFQIDLTPGADPITRAPYRLAPRELQELPNQLQELSASILIYLIIRSAQTEALKGENIKAENLWGMEKRLVEISDDIYYFMERI
ncbi:uncharacterized protein LOC110897604 [Helianthus annuus]|uniref:uncharacterized protein LOC110897604 n=1 Tax=Helianthus annuus TaxID=4232 RepID=UPI000B8F5CB2|nr:uncharacterized protein LOC110897604 [Helianthus annuus]